MPPLSQQIPKIWAAAREVGVEEPQLRDLVARCSSTGSNSIRALNAAEANNVIDALVRLGASSSTGGRGGKRRPSGRRKADGETQMITPRQVEEIARRRAELGEDWIRDEYYAGACRKRLRKDRPATAAEGAKVIEMLKQVLAHERRKAR